jgi:V/A-type H+-transporting ATPase subunit F
MKNPLFITPADARYGFILTGAGQLVIETGQAEETLLKVLADPDCKVAVIDERLISGIAPERLRELEKRWHGVLVVLPAPAEAGAEAAEDYALRLIRRAIGYHVRLQS